MNMPLVLLNRRRRGFTAFSPSSLYSSGSQGIWLDPSDLSTMFSDRAGTTPVTTPGTVVGLRLDKSGRGNHAVAPTDAARPTYGVEPKGGRRNLLTYSEQFDNAAWNAGGQRMLQVTANVATAPDGTTTADKVFEAASGAGSVTHNVIALGAIPAGVNTLSVYAKKAERKRIFLFVNGLNQGAWFDLDTGAFAADGSGATASIQNVGNGWYRCSLTTTPATAGNFFLQVAVIRDSATTFDARVGDGTSGVFLWGADFETGSTATNYQRVLSAYDITESGVATTHYVQYDGSDDSLSTSAIDFTATDKMSVFAGVRKLSDALGGSLIGHSIDPSANNGSFEMFAPLLASAGSNDYSWRSRGTTPQTATFADAAPTTDVVTGLGDIAGDIATLRINGTQVAQSTADQGTGNYGNYPLYIGRRGGTARSFNGRDYGIIVVGKAASSGEITDTETWLAAKTAQVVLP